MKSNVIDFFDASNRILNRRINECIDTNEAVLDTSDVVLTADDLDYDVTVTDDYLIVQTADKDDGDSQS